MNKILLFLAVAILSITSTFAQNSNHQITENRVNNQTIYTYDGNMLTEKQLINKMQYCPDAYKEMKRYKTNKAVGSFFAFTGGALIGWPLGTALGGGEPEWGLAAIGVGVIALGIPFYIATPKRKKRAIEIYNNQIPQQGAQRLEFNFGTTHDGIGICMKF